MLIRRRQVREQSLSSPSPPSTRALPCPTIRGYRFRGASSANDSQTRFSHTADSSRSRDAFERIALSIRRQAAKCKPRGQIGWLFARHYQVYQMLMRGEARYSEHLLAALRSSLYISLGSVSSVANLNDSIRSCISARSRCSFGVIARFTRQSRYPFRTLFDIYRKWISN